jgi:hypothetical protein
VLQPDVAGQEVVEPVAVEVGDQRRRLLRRLAGDREVPVDADEVAEGRS